MKYTSKTLFYALNFNLDIINKSCVLSFNVFLGAWGKNLNIFFIFDWHLLQCFGTMILVSISASFIN